MKTRVLATEGMPERHTGANIAGRLASITAKFNIASKNISAVVRDGAAAMDTCMANLKDEHDWDAVSVTCVCHTNQLVVQQGLKVPKVDQAIADGRKIVGHFKHSVQSKGKLDKMQKEMNKPEHTLIQDVRTRWNSTHDMAERLVEQRWVIHRVLDECDRSELDLEPGQWKILEAVMEILSPFKSATERLSGEKYPTLSLVYPELKKLRKALADNPKDSDTVRQMKEKMSKKMNDKFGTEDSAVLKEAMIATGMDPRYKSLKSLHPDVREKVKVVIVFRVQKEIDDISGEEPEPAAKRMRMSQSSDSSSDDDDDDVSVLHSTSHYQAKQEYEMYLHEPKQEKCDTCPKDKCALEWWRKSSRKFPNVAKVARRVLAIPASSTPSERVFSTAGNIVTKKRACLSSDHVDALVALSMNKL